MYLSTTTFKLEDDWLYMTGKIPLIQLFAYIHLHNPHFLLV
jgi:hypothetical protein